MLARLATFIGMARPFRQIAALTVIRDRGQETFAVEARPAGSAFDLRVLQPDGAVVAQTRKNAPNDRLFVTMSDLGLGRRKRGGLKVATILMRQSAPQPIRLDLRSRALAGI